MYSHKSKTDSGHLATAAELEINRIIIIIISPASLMTNK